MGEFILDARSNKNLIGVNPDLITVVKGAYVITKVKFIVIEGLRTKERQAVLFKAGATKTMNSRHITGHAVDLAAVVGGEIRWDWPLYDEIAVAMKRSSRQFEIPIEWGGDWETFKDGPHWQLPWKDYPI